MFSLPGYEIIDSLHQGGHYNVYQARDLNTWKEVIIKTTKSQFPSVQEIANLRQELDFSSLVDDPGVIKSFEFDQCQSSYYLVQESIGGITLRVYIKKYGISLNKFLELAIILSDILSHIHDKGIIHKDIKPSNIIINPETTQLKITDFSISTRLTQESTTYTSTYALGGTLAYISPEQTGRVNRTLDYRSDLYSLGATFFEMLTGHPPFSAKTPIELVHKHIAVEPTKLSLIKKDIPEVIEKIIDKLLQKNAEDRYQSARGLKFDLERCLELLKQGCLEEGFKIGAADYSAQFQIVQKFYGRKKELKELLQAFWRACSGAKQSVFISSFPGVGKTALVHEVYRPITERHGLFIEGKFEQYQTHIPYAALGQALGRLCDYLLGEAPDILEQWKQNILNALHGEGQILLNIVPRLEPIIGKQSPVPELSAKEAHQRLIRVFQRFFEAICHRDHPITLFLDDMQWADVSTLNLLEALLTTGKKQTLLFIGAYRNNEISLHHPLTSLLEKIDQSKTEVTNIEIENLNVEEISHMVGDTLGHPPLHVTNLAKIIFGRTEGNAFFTKQFLQRLYDEGCLRFSFNLKEWQWDLDEINRQDFTDSVVDMLIEKIKTLPPSIQKVLQLASCLGNSFDLTTLSLIENRNVEKTLSNLWKGIENNLIRPLNQNYRLVGVLSPKSDRTPTEETEQTQKFFPKSIAMFQFVHDRVQEAAYAMIPKEKKNRLHLTIGRLLVKKDLKEDRIYELVSHYQRGAKLIKDRQEKLGLASLSLKAAQKALKASAFDNALSYASLGISLLEQKDWEDNHDLMWRLHCVRAAAEYSCVKLEDSEKTLKLALKKAKRDEEKVEAYVIYLKSLFQLNRAREGAQIGHAALEDLGLKLPKKVSLFHIFFQFLKFRFRVRKDAKNLIELPVNKNKKILNILAVTYAAMPSFDQTAAQNLLPYISLRMANLCLQYGNSVYSPIFYILAAFSFSRLTREFSRADATAKMALELAEKFPDALIKGTVNWLYGNVIYHWKNPVENYERFIQVGYQLCRQMGMPTYATWSLFFCRPQSIFTTPKKLEDVIIDNKECYQIFSELGDKEMCLSQNFIINFLLTLSGSSKGFINPNLPFNQENYEKEMNQPGVHTVRLYFHTFRMLQALEQEKPREAFRYAKLSSHFLKPSLSIYLDFLQRFFYLFIYYRTKNSLNFWEKISAFPSLMINRIFLRHCAKQNPHNFIPAWHLIRAEAARNRNSFEKACRYYEKAIKEAKKMGFAFPLAFCLESAAFFYFEVGQSHNAAFYLREARDIWAKWGAMAKVQMIEKTYPDLMERPVEKIVLHPENLTLEQNQIQYKDASIQSLSELEIAKQDQALFEDTRSWLDESFSRFTDTVDFDEAPIKGLDLQAILKSSYAISNEINFETLLKTLMQIVTENTGAGRACLLLTQENSLVVEAEKNLTVGRINLLKSIPLENYDYLPKSVIHYVFRTKESLVLNNVSEDHRFQDRYLKLGKPKSLLAMPIFYQKDLLGILYLENKLTKGTFTDERLRLLGLISAQVAISLKNARLYGELTEINDKLEKKVEERTKKLKKLAITDSLTGIFNRRYFMEKAQEEFEQSQENKQPLCHMILDADNFKNINDCFGHAVGDRVLVQLTKICLKNLRREDIMGRLGGEEFGLILPKTNSGAAKVIAEKLRRSLAVKPIKIDDQEIQVNVSIGIACRQPEDKNSSEILKRADKALYQAKEKGKNCFEVFQSNRPKI